MSLFFLYTIAALINIARFAVGYNVGIKKCSTKAEAVMCGILGLAIALIFIILLSNVIGKYTSWFDYA